MITRYKVVGNIGMKIRVNEEAESVIDSLFSLFGKSYTIAKDLFSDEHSFVVNVNGIDCKGIVSATFIVEGQND